MARTDQPACLKRFMKIASISLVVMLILIGGGFVLLRSQVRPPVTPDPTATITPTATPPAADVPLPTPEQGAEMPHLNPTASWARRPYFFTFLIFGLDETKNSDSIMVAAYDGIAQRAYIISIPRDTHVYADRWLQKIVEAYPSGRSQGGHAEGVENLMQEVQSLIGFRPDFYICVNDDFFVQVVDTIGGVALYVPFHMYYDDPCQNLHINIPAGLQVLDGENALHFASYRLGNDRRHSITDFQRIRHQHQLLEALFQELLTPSTLLRIPQIIRTYRSYVDTDLSFGEMLWFGEQFYRMRDADALSAYTLPIRGSSGPPRWYELPNGPAILELVNRTVNPFTQDITADMLRLAPAP